MTNTGSAVMTKKRFFSARDELSPRNIRRGMWAAILAFPLAVIIGDLRYFDLHLNIKGFESYELMLFPLGLGWLVLTFLPKRIIIPALKTAALLSAVIIPFQIFLPESLTRFGFFMAFQFLNGICAGASFYLLCFVLNNVERLLGMALIMFYYGFYYTLWRAFPLISVIGKTWGGAVFMALYLAVVFFSTRNKEAGNEKQEAAAKDYGGKLQGAALVIALHIVYYMIMCMINYIELPGNIIDSLPYGLGQYASILTILIIMLISNRSALNIWIIYLVFSLFGICILVYDSPAAHFAGSLVYGLGDGLGYIIIYYLCASLIKRSNSVKMFRLFTLVLFIEYFVISGIYSRFFALVEESNRHYLALGIVLSLSCVCFLLIPLLQKKLFQEDWTDGINLSDIPEYSVSHAETEAVNLNDSLNLTSREQEVFTLLLKGMSPKEIAYTLKVSFHTVVFHRSNLYRKLNVNNIQDLFAKYVNKADS